MTETLHANVFFLITSIAVVIFTILLCVLMYYVIKIAQAVRRITERIEEGSEMVAEDLAHLREMMSFDKLFSFVMNLFARRKKRKTSSRTRSHSDTLDE